MLVREPVSQAVTLHGAEGKLTGRDPAGAKSRKKGPAGQNTRIQVPPVQDARAQGQSVQNAQAPSFLQSLGLRNQTSQEVTLSEPDPAIKVRSARHSCGCL
jgi:hypothetical protein